MSIWAGTTGQLDDVPVEDIRRFESEFLDYLRREQGGLLTAIRETRDFTDDNISTAQEAISRFRSTFEVTGGTMLVTEEEPAEPLGQGEEGRERVNRYGGAGSHGVPDVEGSTGTEPTTAGGPDKAAPVNPEAATEGEGE